MEISGIYKIINLKTNQIYIGSSVNLMRRKYEHFRQLKNGIHNNQFLQNSFNVYGINSFEFVILERCKKSKCIEIEQNYINILKPKYNINPIAGSSLNVKHTNKTIEKIRKSQTGKIKSKETKDKIRLKMNEFIKEHGGVGIKRTFEQKENFRKHPSVVKRIKPILQLSLNDEPIKEWVGGSNEIMRELKYYAIHISKFCNNKRKTAYGYKWKFL